jgi:type II secretory pathway pseudopilin PulG
MSVPGDRSQSGWTLVELLVVAVIGVIITGGLVLTWGSLTKSFSMTTHASDAQDLARDAVGRMSREIRDMEPKGGASAIIAATNDELVFYTTFNEAGNDTPLVEPVRTRYWYTWDAARHVGALHRQRGSGAERIVVDNLMNPHIGDDGDVFRYTYVANDRTLVTDGPSPEGTEFDSISMIRVNLSLDLNPQSAPEPMNVTTRVHLRNQGRY